MKHIIYVLLLTVFIIGCASTSQQKDNLLANTKSSDTVRIANDSLEYEIIIIEPGFNAWLATQPPRGFYGQPFLEIRNNFLVTNYNIRARNPTQFDPNIYILPIDYRSGIDYGYEVNYLLFNWFIFFQKEYNQDLGLRNRIF